MEKSLKPIKQMGLEKFLFSLKVFAYKNQHLEMNFKKKCYQS